MAEFRYPLEALRSPFGMALNPNDTYDHCGIYIYRVYKEPIVVTITFEATGPSAVEVLDADNNRFLLPENTQITTTTSFDINWDGQGTFQPRVWKNSDVAGITITFIVPPDQVISEPPQYRYPLEITPSPFDMVLNPGPVYDHAGLYIYRILATPITMAVTFTAMGASFVEVFDADNQKWLLGEKVPIDTTTTFRIDWDGTGVFEPRVWLGGSVTGIRVEYTLPKIEVVGAIPRATSYSPWILLGGVVLAAGGYAKSKGLIKRGTRKK